MSRLFLRSLFICLVTATCILIDSNAQKTKRTSGGERGAQATAREAEFYFTEAEKFFILEDYAKALVFLQKTVELVPGNATVHFKIADVYNRGTTPEDLQKAATSIEKALTLEKKNKYFYLLAVNIYNGLSDFDRVIKTYESMLQQITGLEEYYFELAASYQYANRPEDAIKAYTLAEIALGVNEMSSIQKIKLYLEAKKIKEASQEASKLLSLDSQEERYVMSIAELFSQQNLKNEAIEYLELFLLQPLIERSNAELMLTGLLLETLQLEKAEKILLQLFNNNSVEFGSKALILASLNADIANPTGLMLNEKKRLATSLFEILSKNYPDEAQLPIIGGDLFLSVGNTQRAKEEYKRAIALGDVNIEVWQNLLYLEAQADQFDAILKYSEQALEIYPNQGMLHYFHGYALFRKRQFNLAVKSLEQAKKLSVSNPAFVNDLNSLLGDSYNSLKEYSKADLVYEEALAFNPNNAGVLNNYSYYLSLRKENLEKAEKMSTQLVKEFPNDATFLDTHAWVLYQRGKYKEAKKIIERALLISQNNATHLEHYGDILFRLGEVQNAIDQWQRAKLLNPASESLNKKISSRALYE